jgi:hypothetical protein
VGYDSKGSPTGDFLFQLFLIHKRPRQAGDSPHGAKQEFLAQTGVQSKHGNRDLWTISANISSQQLFPWELDGASIRP